MMTNTEYSLENQDLFPTRHIGPREKEVREILDFLKLESLNQLIASTIPSQIRTVSPLKLKPALSENEALAKLRQLAIENTVFRSFLGMGYSDCITPAVIQRNILENPGWYTAYTPYQAEIAQGRLEALLNFQTMIIDLTGMPVANASLLDEGTAAAEAMALCFAVKGRDLNRAFFVSDTCHSQTLSIIRTRAEPLGIRIIVGAFDEFDFNTPIFGALLQYPSAEGSVCNYKDFIGQAHAADAMVVVAADIMSLTLLIPPGEFGADIAVGSTQRFGVPLGYGGPHAAYFATRDEYKRQIPGRIVGLSKDTSGKPAVRLALQTREQHIRRDKATSNICTAQVLLAVIASMYAVYHGPDGLKKIASRIHLLTRILEKGLLTLGYSMNNRAYFDTLSVFVGKERLESILSEAKKLRINLRTIDAETIGVSLDETVSEVDLTNLFAAFAHGMGKISELEVDVLVGDLSEDSLAKFFRNSKFLTHPTFNSYRSETEMLRYIYRLQAKDLSLTTSMIPLGSCTMKLNATSEMYPVTWPEFSRIHPFVPLEQVPGYQTMLGQLEEMLKEITGFSGISLQPNAGSQGEYAGLLVIRKYHQSRGDKHRDICLIPRSAHGTNPASAVMAGMKVVVVDCDSIGNIDLSDLNIKVNEHRERLAALMITYPSTHGVFEESITQVCSLIHDNGGQVYMDGANMNAQIGLCRPGDYGPDVCHLNLHKTFCIPHGGGGPGMGPIGVARHLVPFLPTHPVIPMASESGIGPVSAAPWGSASILLISWMYITLMGEKGLTHATEVAILNANYIAKRLSPYFPVLYQGKNGFVAHECIFDLRDLKDSAGIDVEDVAKRLMDYGFHAPTISFPVSGTLMVEPTESESKAELDRFCEAMISIREEISEIQKGKADRKNNVLKNAPHTQEQLVRAEWPFPYSREKAVFPASWVREHKYWPPVGRIDNVAGDRNLVCACPSTDMYAR